MQFRHECKHEISYSDMIALESARSSSASRIRMLFLPNGVS